VYTELHRIASHQMRHEGAGHLLQATALVNEAYLRLAGGSPLQFRDRGHFFAIASRQMRRVLVDHSRAELAARRGGRAIRIDIASLQIPSSAGDRVWVLLDEALNALEVAHPDEAKIVELKVFGGYTDLELSGALGIAISTVRRHWDFARRCLHLWMTSNQPET